MSTVRVATAQDSLPLAYLVLASWRAAYTDLLPAEVFESFDLEDMARQIKNTEPVGGTVLVAPTDGPPLAMVNFGRSRDDIGGVEIYSVCARPEAFGTGLGPALMAETIARTARPLTLWVLADNPRARRFYAKSGFIPDGQVRNIIIGGVTLPEVRYRLRD